MPIQIVGVNESGHESGNENITDGRDLPWLQEVSDTSIWGEWSITYRDVVILDAENKPVAIYNLTNNDLSEAEKFDELKALFLEAAGP